MHAGGGMGSEDEGVSFAHALATLKERGSALLVVGSVPEEMFVEASATMLGDPSADPPRRRLVVTPDSSRESAVDRLRRTGPLSSEYARLVTRGESARSAAAADATDLDTLSPRTHVIDGSLSDLGSTIDDVVEEFDLFAGGLEPAEFRMAFDCLPTLLSVHDRETVFQFLHLVVAQTRQASGLVHFRLPQDVDSETVRLFEPLFDAMVELGIDGDELIQRWHFRDRDLTSDWLPLRP